MAWYKTEPKVLGHEPSGEAVEVGAGVTDDKVGDRLIVNHHVGRVNSHLSRRGHFTRDPFYKTMRLDPGGVCDYFRVTAQHLAMDTHKLPDKISDEEAVTSEPWSCVLLGLRVCKIQPGDTVEAFRTLNKGRLANTVIVIAPFPSAWEPALGLVEVGGCLHLGAPLPPETDWVQNGHKAYFDQITITSRYSFDHTDTYSYIRLLEAGPINAKDAISHRFDIADSAEAFHLLAEAEKSLKIVVYPQGVPDA